MKQPGRNVAETAGQAMHPSKKGQATERNSEMVDVRRIIFQVFTHASSLHGGKLGWRFHLRGDSRCSALRLSASLVPLRNVFGGCDRNEKRNWACCLVGGREPSLQRVGGRLFREREVSFRTGGGGSVRRFARVDFSVVSIASCSLAVVRNRGSAGQVHQISERTLERFQEVTVTNPSRFSASRGPWLPPGL